MFDWFRKRVMAGLGGRCPVCGSDHVSAELTTIPRWVVDGPTYCAYKCRKCGHTWRILARSGV